MLFLTYNIHRWVVLIAWKQLKKYVFVFNGSCSPLYNQVCVLLPQNTNKFRRKNMFNIYNVVLVSETSPFILNTRKFNDKGLKVLYEFRILNDNHYCSAALVYDFSHHNDE